MKAQCPELEVFFITVLTFSWNRRGALLLLLRDAGRDVKWFCVSRLAHGANERGFVGPMRTNCELEHDSVVGREGIEGSLLDLNADVCDA